MNLTAEEQLALRKISGMAYVGQDLQDAITIATDALNALSAARGTISAVRAEAEEEVRRKLTTSSRVHQRATQAAGKRILAILDAHGGE